MTDWLFCTSGSALAKAGEHNAMTTAANLALSGSLLLEWYHQAEGRIEYETNTAWSGSWATLDNGTKYQLSNVCSALIAMDIISYNNTGYLTREADTLMNKNNNIVNTGLRLLTVKSNHTLLTP